MREEVSISCKKADVICFGGGDGTFNLVVNEVLKNETRPILAYIPSGTANDIASNLKISKNVKKAVKVICEGSPIYHDVGKVNSNYFVYICGAGTFTGVSYSTKKAYKNWILKYFKIIYSLWSHCFTFLFINIYNALPS